MKKVFAVLILILFLFSHTIGVIASEVKYDEKMKAVEGRYTLKVKVDSWTKSSQFADQSFPDTSIVHEVEIEIQYDGQKPGYTTPLFTVYVNGQITDKVTVGFSSSGGSGLFVNARDLPVPSLGGEGRTIQVSARFNYNSETSEYTLSTDAGPTIVKDATYAVGRGSTTMAATIEENAREDSTAGNKLVGGSTEGEAGEGNEGSTSDNQPDEGFVEEEELVEEEEELIEEEEVLEEKEAEEEEEEEEEEEQQIVRGITFVKGNVAVKRAGSDKWIRARRNMPLNPGDTVKTDKNSYADLGCGSSEFSQATNEGGVIMMPPLSTFTVQASTKVKVERKSKMRVMMNDAVKNLKALVGKEEIEIETPSAVAGIRGTDFIVDVDEDGNTTFLLYEGKIAVKSHYDNQEIMLNPGEKILAPVNSTLSGVEHLTDEEKEVFTTNYKEDKSGIGLFGTVMIALIILIMLLVVLKKRKDKKKTNKQPQPITQNQTQNTAQEAIRYCCKCGNAVKSNAGFCSNCGNTMK